MSKEKPFPKKSTFHAKAIETRYDGYKFRSRLEARYATFFNVLQIPYIYELEGFVLEGTPYLPDFYLPKFDCFVEIKGVEPTQEELKKARLLSLYTMKRVYIFSGEVGKDTYGAGAYGFRYPSIGLWTLDDPIKEMDAPPEVYWTIQRLEDAGYILQLNEQKNDLSLRHHQETWEITEEDEYTWDDMCAQIAERGRDTVAAMDLLKKHRSLAFETLKPKREGDDWVWSEMQGWDFYAWGECSNCSVISICHPDLYYNPCGCHADVNYDSPRILSAYTTAREARF